MSQGIHAFDALYVISDLHLGDDPSRSMFQDSERLGDFIRHVAAQRPDERVALALNGDIVDFLAGPKGARFDPENAAARLVDIARSFSPVFEALRVFTATARRRLILTLGNHDIELALPAVTETLLSLVCEREEDRGRVLLSLDGAGLRCEVGGRSIFIVHGNDSDDWNTVNHEALRETAAAMNMGAKLPSWTSNAGTTLVVRVLNRVKSAHPWVELLKPEDESLVALLLAIDPTTAEHIRSLPEISAKLAYGAFRRRLLGDDDDAASSAANRGPATRGEERDAIAAALAQVDKNVRPTELVGAESLGWFTAYFRSRGGRADLSGVREELSRWRRETGDTFEVTHTSKADAAFLEDVASEVDVVIAGHTHIARAQPRLASSRRDDDQPWYFNSGTWIALVDIGEALLASDDAFEPVWQTLNDTKKTLRDLLAEANPVIRRAASAVRIETRGAKVRGELLYFPTRGDAPVAHPVGACEFDAKAGG